MIEGLKRDLLLTEMELALAKMQQRWSQMDEYEQTASLLPDEMETILRLIEEELGSESDEN